MAFREVSVIQIKEALRLWLKGSGVRGPSPSRWALTERRCDATSRAREPWDSSVMAVSSKSPSGQGQLVERVRPHQPDDHGDAWRTLLVEDSRNAQHATPTTTLSRVGPLAEVPASWGR